MKSYYLSLSLLICFLFSSCSKTEDTVSSNDEGETTNVLNSKSSTLEVQMTDLINSNLSKIRVDNASGTNVFDLSNFEAGDFSSFSGFMTINNHVSAANISLSNDYMDGFCIDEIETDLYSVKVDNSELYQIEVTGGNSSQLTFDYTGGGLAYSFVLKNGSLPTIFDDLSNSTCDINGGPRWIPFAMAVVAAVTAVSCGISNVVDSGNCAGVADGCENGVASYEYEGGSCGGGDCDVVCNE